MGLSAGAKLGSYEVVAPLGAGGMGEVWRARDATLGRDVAIKVLPDAFSEDPERLARFQREAEVLASLNHPNIAGIYGLETSGPNRALVLELVEGPTLAERLAEGRLALDEAIAIARQIAEALEAAHDAGVIHRDLKPANVKVKEDGTVKVLDFGLAKALGGDDREGDPSESPTLTTAATREGVIMGTAAYMSPEQARGKRVDKRADVWAFGAVLYEMLTGKRAFSGEDVSETLAFVLTKEPDWSALPGDVPPTLRAFLTRCLEKDPRRRVRDVGDVRLALEGAFDTVSDSAEPTAVARRTVPWVAAVAVLASLLTGVVVSSLMRSDPPEVTRFAYELPAGHEPYNRGAATFAVSPDGRRFAYSTSDGVYVRSMDQLEPRLLGGTDERVWSLTFSPDGRSIAYWDGSQLKRLAVSGGAPVVVCSPCNEHAAGTRPNVVHWAWDDTILFSLPERGILRVSANGGTPEVVVSAAPGEVVDAPRLLPDGDTVLVTVIRGSATGIAASSWDRARLVALSLNSGERTELLEGGSDARYVASGHLVYAFEDGLFAVGFDPGRLRVTSGPVSLVEGVDRAQRAASANYDVTDDGTLFFLALTTAPNHRLSWVDRSGRTETIETIPRHRYETPRLSPDGERVLVVADGNLRIYELASGRETRLTTDGTTRYYADWTPSGTDVTYSSSRGSRGEDVWIQPTDGSGTARQLTEVEGQAHFDGWAPDGRTFSAHLHDVSPTTKQLMISFDGDTWQVDRWIDREFSAVGAVFSPDGRYVALASYQTGQEEIVIHPFPGPGGPTPVSVGGGREAAWAKSGEIFYRRPSDYRMMVVQVSTDPVLTVGPPQELFAGSWDPGGSPRARYAVTADGQRFLMSAGLLSAGGSGAEGGERPKVVIVQNWVEELKARVPN